MIFHSIVPIDVVFGNGTQGEEMNFLEMEYMGEKIQVSPLTNNQFMITRLFSTSLKAYLNPKLQPGTIINMVKDN